MTVWQESISIRAILQQLAREATLPKMSRQKREEHLALSLFAIFDR